jgi:hypothetical protein
MFLRNVGFFSVLHGVTTEKTVPCDNLRTILTRYYSYRCSLKHKSNINVLTFLENDPSYRKLIRDEI